MKKETEKLLDKLNGIIYKLSKTDRSEVPFTLAFVPQRSGNNMTYSSLVLGDDVKRASYVICTMMLCSDRFREFVSQAQSLYKAVTDESAGQDIIDMVNADTFAYNVLKKDKEERK